MNNLDELEKIVVEESKPFDIQKTGDIDHYRRLAAIEAVGKKIIDILIISEKNNNVDDINRCNNLIHRCFEIVEKESEYDNFKFSIRTILTQYLKKSKEGTLLSLKQYEQLVTKTNQISDQITMFLESVYPLEDYILMTDDERDKYDFLCQKYKNLEEECALNFALLHREDLKKLSKERVRDPKLNKEGLMTTRDILDYDKINPTCDHNLEIAKQYVDKYIEFEKNKDIPNMNKAKKVIFYYFYLLPYDRTNYYQMLSNYITSKGYSVDAFYVPLSPGVHELPNGDMVLIESLRRV